MTTVPFAFCLIYVSLGFVLGAAIVWAASSGGRTRAERLRREVETVRLERAVEAARACSERESFERERATAAAQRQQLESAFRSIGAEVLDANAAKVGEIARGVLAEQQAVAKGDFDLRSQAVQKLVEPVSATLSKLDEQLRAIEVKRAGSYEDLKGKVDGLAASEALLKASADELSRNTAGLMQALRSSGARGRWGEVQLRRIVELAGMIAHCDFDQQSTVASFDGGERPDLRIHLTTGRFVVVDAKAPLAAYLEAFDAVDDITRGVKLKAHARAMRAHVAELARREYRQHDQNSPDFKVMFVPSEGALSAALTEDPEIFDDSIADGVCIASPTTLIAMLRVMSMGWRQQALEDNARKIAELGSELYERIGKVAEHLTRVGSSLGATVNAYNGLVGSVEGRLVVTGRRLQELGAVPASQQLAQPELIDRSVRVVAVASVPHLGFEQLSA